LNTESAANWDRKNDLPFGGDFGAHGKMILPYSVLVLNYFAFGQPGNKEILSQLHRQVLDRGGWCC
jgi:hypothetical protein